MVETMHTVQVPILGEGIQEARIVTLHKQPGDTVVLDDALCEVETAKLFSVESSVEGVEEWLIEEEDDVEVGQKLALIQLSNGVAESEPENTTRFVLKVHIQALREAREQLQAVVQATVNVDVSWEPIRTARQGKAEFGADAPSPSLMVALAVVQAMKHNKPFTSLLEDEGLRMQPDDLTRHCRSSRQRRI